MNSDTGHIAEFDSLDEAFKQGYTIPVKRKDGGCFRCNGTGSIKKRKGKKIRYSPCKCVL